MDLRDPKTQKYLLGALAVFLALYFWYNRVYTKTTTVIKQKQVQYELLLSDLKSVEMKSKSFESLKEEYEKLLERYRRVERLLPEERQIPLLLTQMHSAASSHQIGIIELLPEPAVPIGFYNSSSFGVQLTGSYHDLGDFLSKVANFPFLADVTGMSITALPQEEQSREKEDNTITASLTLTTYYVKEEEKLKKLEF
jgi:type IV pilus assembly protein PilO